MEQAEISQSQLHQWVATQLLARQCGPLLDFSPLPGDASFRRYFRAKTASASYIAAFAPPDKENNTGFVAVAKLLHDAAVPAPQVLGANLQHGFLLLSDLGDQVLLHRLNAGNAGEYYALALTELVKMQQIKPAPDMPLYSGAVLMTELGRFQEWFVEGLLAITLNQRERQLIEHAQQIIVASADSQPQVFVHRDFQSRNLMPQENGQLAIIDFQDAAIGPLTYDVACLLRDTHIDWPPEQVREWALNYARLAQQHGLLPDDEEETFLRWFDLNSLERNITVLGTFSRLYLRDGKSDYLPHLPRLIHYILTIAKDYPEFVPFLQWFQNRLLPIARQQDWYKECDQ
ncbi:MAG: aminoglycoside phosphotransferase family protein [Pseudomonadales bacterium]